MESIISDDFLTEDSKIRIQNANTALEILEISREIGFDIATPIAERALQTAIDTLRGATVAVDVVITDRKGEILARAG